MKFNPNILGLAFAAAFAVLWVICSLLVFGLPGYMMTMTGHMAHANLYDLGWTLTITGFLVGLVGWVVTAWATGWLIGFFYNKFAK